MSNFISVVHGPNASTTQFRSARKRKREGDQSIWQCRTKPLLLTLPVSTLSWHSQAFAALFRPPCLSPSCELDSPVKIHHSEAKSKALSFAHYGGYNFIFLIIGEMAKIQIGWVTKIKVREEEDGFMMPNKAGAAEVYFLRAQTGPDTTETQTENLKLMRRYEATIGNDVCTNKAGNL